MLTDIYHLYFPLFIGLIGQLRYMGICFLKKAKRKRQKGFTRSDVLMGVR